MKLAHVFRARYPVPKFLHNKRLARPFAIFLIIVNWTENGLMSIAIQPLPQNNISKDLMSSSDDYDFLSASDASFLSQHSGMMSKQITIRASIYFVQEPEVLHHFHRLLILTLVLSLTSHWAPLISRPLAALAIIASSAPSHTLRIRLTKKEAAEYPISRANLRILTYQQQQVPNHQRFHQWIGQQQQWI